MKKESILTGVIGLLTGVVIAGFAAGWSVNSNNTGMMRMMGMNTNKNGQQTSTNHGSMSTMDMSNQLKDRTGDDFDKAFVELMITHHEGAIDMAGLIPSRAKHNEIKRLGEAIITSQTKEINDMKQWQKDWGYPAGESMLMMH